jgi:hypothetical protein
MKQSCNCSPKNAKWNCKNTQIILQTKILIIKKESKMDTKFKLWNIIKSPILTLGTTIIALITVVISFMQIQSANMTANTVKKVEESISTRYVEQFPTSMTKINELLNEAKKEIIIFEDVLGYGLFSNPEKFHEYLTILDKAASNNKKIEIVVYNSELNFRTRQMQHIGSDSIELFNELKRDGKIQEANNLRDKIFTRKTKRDPEFKEMLSVFRKHIFANDYEGKYNSYPALDKIKEKLKNDNLTFIDFYDVLEEMNKCIETILTRGEDNKRPNVKIHYVAMQNVMNCWAIDKDKAICGFVGNIKSSEIDFATHDPKLIEYIYSELLKNVDKLKLDPYGDYINYR